jgi:hypothetical protein
LDRWSFMGPPQRRLRTAVGSGFEIENRRERRSESSDGSYAEKPLAEQALY